MRHVKVQGDKSLHDGIGSIGVRGWGLTPAVAMDVSHRPGETSPVSSPAVATSRSPYAGGFLTAALQALRRVPGLRLA